MAGLTAPPPPLLDEFSYDTIFGLAKGLTLEQMAVQACMSRRMVCKHLEYLKARLNVSTREEIILRAVDMGIL